MQSSNLLIRIKRIQGQINGIKKMLENDKPCLEILQQITAAKSALSGLAKELLITSSCRLAAKKNQKKFKTLLSKLSSLS